MSTEQRVVAITGAARGIGRSCVRAFLDRGAKVAAIDLSWQPSGNSGDRDDAFYRELAARPEDVAMITCDVSDPVQVQAAYDEAMRRFGTVDFLYNNAGMRMMHLYPPTGRGVDTLHTKREEWEKMFAVTVFGTMDLTKLFIQPMIAKGRGSILTTISSGAIINSHGGAYMALRPNSREVPYMPAKAAIMCSMFYLADEVAEYNVAVNILVPGHTRTTGFDEQNAARRLLDARVAGDPATQRINATPVLPDHVVPLVTFLAECDATSGVTGKCFDTMTWNVEHGAGGFDHWADPEAERGIDETYERLYGAGAAN